MNFIKNLKIRYKLIIMLLILLIPTIILLFDVTIYSVKEYKQLKKIEDNLHQVVLVSTLIHHLQDERALTYGYLGTGGGKFGNKLDSQRQETNVAINQLEDHLEEQDNQFSGFQFFSKLREFRQRIDQHELDSLEFEHFYQEVRKEFISRLKDDTREINDHELRKQLQAHSNLVIAKEYLGQLRTLFNNFFTRKGLSYKEYNSFGNYHLLYSYHEEDFLNTTSENIRHFYNEKIAEKEYRKIHSTMEKMLENPSMDFSGFDEVYWYSLFTSYLENLRNVEKYSLGYIKNLLSEKIEKNYAQITIYFIIVFLSFSLSISLALYLVRYIINSVTILRRVSAQVSQGISKVKIPLQSKDEFGMLADSYKQMVSRNTEMAYLAESIGKGNYEGHIITAGEQDLLGNSLLRMKENLEKLSSENEKRNWMLTGIFKLNDLMSGAIEINSLGRKIIDFLCKYLEAEIGAIFVHDEQRQYHFVAGYGITRDNKEVSSFFPGEGLAGEAVQQQDIKIIKNVAPGNFKIKTGIAEWKAAHLLLAPASFNKKVVGLIEIGTRNNFSNLHVEFMNEAVERIAIVFNSLLGNLKTQELLQETQSQTEELESQQEELRQVNIELREQKDQLQDSQQELRASQEELMEKNAELEEKANKLEEQYEILSLRNKELDDAKRAFELKVEQVETISKYKSDFLANMSHELRTPLNSIMILSKLIMDDALEHGLDKDVEHAKIIQKSGNDLLKLINGILDLSFVESGQMKLDIKPVLLSSLDSPKEFVQQAKIKNIKYNVNVDASAPGSIKTDQFRLEQVLRNFLSNAFKFTQENGVIDFNIFTPPTGEFTGYQDKKMVAFQVKDNGIGIPREKQQIIFEAFQQADNSITREFGGTGLGLSISKEIAQLLGGSIVLESQEGKGSTFTLLLPVEFEKDRDKEDMDAKMVGETFILPGENKEDVISHQAGENKKNILIIEDDKGFNNIIADFAKERGFNVSQAFTGAEGLETLNNSFPDVLFLDIQLPGINGLEILKKMKKNKRLKHVKVHLMSAYNYEKQLKEINEIDRFLVKPISMETLSRAFIQIGQDLNNLEKVLIVEDNDIENDAIAKLLDSHGISSYPVFSGEEALQVLKTRKFDAIILDLLLPGIDGYKVMQDLRKSHKNIPIIVYSGKNLTGDEERKLKKFANTIIIKNEYSFTRLMDEVQLFLNNIQDKLIGENKGSSEFLFPGEILKHKKILLVDDDIRNIYSLYNIFEKEGMVIEVANDGQEAIKKLMEIKDIDIILMDIMMPKLDGIQAIREIRKLKTGKHVPIIALTAKAMKEEREKCIGAGASDFLTKPINIEKLVTLMKVWVYDQKNKERS